MMIGSDNEPLDVSHRISIDKTESQRRQVYQFLESGLIKVSETEERLFREMLLKED